MKLKSPVSLFMEITSNCNLSCKHCYNNSNKSGTDSWTLQEIQQILMEAENSGVVAVTISGGEPLVHRKFWDTIKFANEKTQLRISVNTNGTTLRQDSVKRLLDYGIDDIQVSVDGLEEIHDFIRGRGRFRRTTEAIKLASDAGIRVRIGFTANSKNYQQVAAVARTTQDLGATSMAVFRYVPSSKRDLDRELAFDSQSLECCSTALIGVQQKFAETGFNIYMDPLSFFLFLLNSKYANNIRCRAGLGQLTLTQDRMAISCAHFRSEMASRPYAGTIESSWNQRWPTTAQDQVIPNECHSCKFAEDCRGGCPGIRGALGEDMLAKKDPSCFREHL